LVVVEIVVKVVVEGFTTEALVVAGLALEMLEVEALTVAELLVSGLVEAELDVEGLTVAVEVMLDDLAVVATTEP
jgi:hypothetical protein